MRLGQQFESEAEDRPVSLLERQAKGHAGAGFLYQRAVRPRGQHCGPERGIENRCDTGTG